MTSRTEIPEMFPIADRLTFGRDRWGRLRIAVPLEQRPIAAWLHGDVQANVPMQDSCLELLDTASGAPDRILDGNACRLTFWDGGWVELHSHYHRWSPVWTQLTSVVDAINECRMYRLQEPASGDDGHNGGCYGAVIESRDSAEQMPLTYRTFFPDSWGVERVKAATEHAWNSDAFCADETTGAWSGVSNGLEIAGYFDSTTGHLFTVFPVLNR